MEREGNAFMDAIVFVVFHFHQRTAKILIGQTGQSPPQYRDPIGWNQYHTIWVAYVAGAQKERGRFHRIIRWKDQTYQSQAKVIPFEILS